MSLAFAKGLTPRPGRAGAAAAAAPAGASRQRGLLGFSVLLSGLLGFMSPAPLLGWLEVSVLEPALVSAAGAFGLAGLLARLASLAEEGRERSMVAGPRPIGWLFLPLIIFPLQSHMHSSSDLPRSWLRAAAGRSFAFLSIAVGLPCRRSARWTWWRQCPAARWTWWRRCPAARSPCCCHWWCPGSARGPRVRRAPGQGPKVRRASLNASVQGCAFCK